MAAAQLFTKHESAATYDLASLGYKVETLGSKTFSYRTACLLILELSQEPTSHLFSKLNEWHRPSSFQEIGILTLLQAVLGLGGVKKSPLKYPWDKLKKPKIKPELTPEQLDKIKKRLRRMTAIKEQNNG